MSKQHVNSILNRVQDTDISLSDFPGGIMDKYARQLSDDELVDLLRHLDYLSRGEPDPQLRWRYESTITFLKTVAKRREVVASEQEVQDLATKARQTGKETCGCGAHHEEGSNYYVSVADAGKTVLLSGPYRTHAESLAVLPTAREKALQVDRESQFYSFGTVAMPKKHRNKGILDPL